MTDVLGVTTRHGDARLHLDRAADARATLVLTHGAGGGIDSPDLAWFASHAANLTIDVVRVEMPWRVAGKRIAPRPAILDECWLDVFATWVRPTYRLIVGGRSAGARVALRTAEQIGADAVLALAFPLHPPGKPARSRAAELAVTMPVVVVQGARDPFGRPEEFPAGTPIVVQTGSGHDLKADPLLGQALTRLLT